MNTPARERTRSSPRSLLTLLALAFAVVGNAHAAFPDRPIKIITTAAPGAATDITARLIAEHMTRTLKQSVIIETQAGGGGNIGVGLVARANPDGYTLLITSTAFVAGPFLYKTALPYDPEKSFAPVSELVTYYNVLATRPNFPAKTLPEFIKYAKDNHVSMGGGNVGGQSWIMMSKLNKMADLKLDYIAYKGTGPALTDVIGGHLDAVMSDPASLKAFIADGKVTAIAATTPKRSAGLPQVPAFAEAVPGYSQEGWIGMFAPAGTPKENLQIIYKAVAEALADPAVRTRFVEGDFGIVGSTPDEFTAFIKTEIAAYGKIISDTGVKLDQ